jgi:hypothetical protein
LYTSEAAFVILSATSDQRLDALRTPSSAGSLAVVSTIREEDIRYNRLADAAHQGRLGIGDYRQHLSLVADTHWPDVNYQRQSEPWAAEAPTAQRTHTACKQLPPRVPLSVTKTVKGASADHASSEVLPGAVGTSSTLVAEFMNRAPLQQPCPKRRSCGPGLLFFFNRFAEIVEHGRANMADPDHNYPGDIDAFSRFCDDLTILEVFDVFGGHAKLPSDFIY